MTIRWEYLPHLYLTLALLAGLGIGWLMGKIQKRGKK